MAAVQMLSASEGWAVGANGTILRYRIGHCAPDEVVGPPGARLTCRCYNSPVEQGNALPLYIGAGLAAIAVAALLLAWSARIRRGSGLPEGTILGSDVGERERGKPRYSPRYGLAGAPDYIVQTRDGPVPVEIKPSRTEQEPHESHLLQVLAYCLLLEETEGKAPPYGLLRYKHDTFKVDYNADTRAYLLEVVAAIRADQAAGAPDRNHEVEGRCRACGYRHLCDQSLWSTG